MGTALRNPGQIVSFGCDSTVVEGAVLVLSTADDKVALPSGAATTAPIVGLARTATANSTSNVDVVINGFFPGTASGAITRGDRLVVASSAGDVRTYAAATDAGASIVGFATETVNSGERVGIELAGAPAPAVQPLQTGSITLVAGVATQATGITITANSKVFLQLTAPGAGTNGANYKVTGMTNGGPGVGAFTVTAVTTAAGATAAGDVSVLSYLIVG